MILASSQKLTYHALDSMVPLDSTGVRKEARKLGVAHKLDTTILFPTPSFVLNTAPTFSGAMDISRTLDTTAQVVPNWITAIAAGSKNDSGQSVRFEVAVDSGASLFSALPTVDSAGTLRYQAKSAGKGVFRVRAHDNGDSTGTNVNVSAWKAFAIQLFSRPVLIATGPTDTVRLVEDSATTVSFAVQNFVGSSLSVKFAPVDTSLISVHSWTLAPDANGKVSIALQGKPYAYGGPITTIVTLSDSLDAANLIVPLTFAARNNPPTFEGAPNLVVTASTATKSFPGWIDFIAAGPANESYQKVSFQVQVLSGSSLFAKAPSVDSAGTLSFAGNANSSGLAQIQVRAVDNDSVDPGNRYSAWKTASIFFNTAPFLSLPNHSVSTWENLQVSVGAMTVSDQETSPAHLSLTWTVSDSTVLPHDSVVATFSGTTIRNLTLHPLAHHWGASKVVFTVTDSLGGTARDSLTLTVNPVNHAPTLVRKSPTLLATTWKGEQTYALATVSWDDVAQGQSGRVDLKFANLTDSVYLSALRVDSAGTLHVLAKIDTSVSISFQIRAHDNGGTANGGEDTSSWSSLQILQLVDTVLDADGNSYRAKVLGTQTWMTSNFQRVVGTDACAFDSCGKYGRLYPWEDALNMSTFAPPSSLQGICPEGWHVPTVAEWATLQNWSGDSSYFKLRSRSAWTDTTYHLGIGYGRAFSIGTDRYGFAIQSTRIRSASNAATGDAEISMGTNLWTSSMSLGLYQKFATIDLFAGNQSILTSSPNDPPAGNAVIRCMKDATERTYYGISP